MTVVAQLARTFAATSETFIYTQISNLRCHQGVMLARDRRNADHFPGVDVVTFSENSSGWGSRVSDVLYRGLRVMSPYERHFYLKAVDRLQPSLFHIHYAVDAAYFAPVTSRYRVPTVVSCYGYDVASFPRQYAGLGGRYLERAWRSADAYLAMSEDMRQDMLALGCPAERIRIHYHGINLARFPYVERSPSPERVRVLFVGRMDEKKGIDYAIHGFAEAAREQPNAEMRIVGDGPLRAKYEQLARSLGVDDRVVFAGFVPHDQLEQEYAAAHVFCHPSVTTPAGDKEGIPGTIVESMATGLPVVTARHAGIPEMVLDGEHGFVVAERDVAAIAHALRRLIQDDELRRRLGDAAAKRAAERGDAVRQTAALESIYKELQRELQRR